MFNHAKKVHTLVTATKDNVLYIRVVTANYICLYYNLFCFWLLFKNYDFTIYHRITSRVVVHSTQRRILVLLQFRLPAWQIDIKCLFNVMPAIVDLFCMAKHETQFIELFGHHRRYHSLNVLCERFIYRATACSKCFHCKRNHGYIDSIFV